MSDLAVASALVRSGRLKEKQISRAVRSWTVYGSQPLIDQLVACRLLEESEKSKWLDEANRLQESTSTAAGISSKDSSGSTRGAALQTRLDTLDTSGRLAKLLGLQRTVELKHGDTNRQMTSRFKLIRKIGEGGLGIVWACSR